ncbi:MAG: S8 family serine peptidase, partial [Gammaproteobacteria bacterium]|nr:S8 family serine peptidase [Gammaproteobacteria bacterium]
MRSSHGRSSGSISLKVRLYTLAGLVALIGLVTIVVTVGVYKVDSELNRVAKATDADSLMAATDRIEHESRGAPPPPVEAATLEETRGSPPEVNKLPNLPDGYATVGFSGEMKVVPVRGLRNSQHPDDSDDRRLDWIESSEVDELMALANANERDWSFGWIKLAEGARRAELEQSLSDLGAHVVGDSGWLLRVRFPADVVSLEAVARLPGVEGIGAMPASEKLQAFDGWTQDAPGHEPTPVFITLMDDDATGRWRLEMESLGAVVGHYDPQVRVYTANVTQDVLQALAVKDFVLSVEPIGIVKTLHETSIPAMGADALRTWIGPGLFFGIGGASVPIGVMDTGLNIRHVDIRQNRTSICGSNFVWLDPREQDEDLWIDAGDHGTHVTGTMIANGFGSGAFAGMAPSVQHVRFAKVLHSEGRGSADSMIRGMDWLATRSGCEGSSEVMPMIVNMSLSGSSLVFEGRDVGTRKLDAVVWHSNQLYVVSQSNEGTAGFSNLGAAKNSLAVGAVYDGGNHAVFSSHGPTADGRLAPQVVATGVDVCSTRGGGAAAGYVCWAGTSMSSPTVAGAAALLMDASPEYKRQPALVRARLMASAVRPDAWLEDSTAFAVDNSMGPAGFQNRYGLGKVSARTLVLDQKTSAGWSGGGATAEFEEDGMYAYQDIVVPENAGRLEVVMTWDEPPVDAVVGSVLNDLDLWLDIGADCGDGPCGERSSTSRIDNVEWVIVKNPAPGTWRLKIVKERSYTDVKAAVAWNIIRGASTPRLTVDVDRVEERNSTDSARQVEIDFSVNLDGYVASGAALHLECRGESDDCDDSSLKIEARNVMREDGLETVAGTGDGPGQRGPDIELGQKIPLGEIGVGETQAVELVVEYSGTKPARLHYTVSAWNAHGASGSVVIQPSDNTDMDELPPVQSTFNDNFNDATDIEGDEGSITVELAGATPEPGEPQASTVAADYGLSQNRWHKRPLGSLWYRWQAPSNGLGTFWLVSQESEQRTATLEVFKGSTLAGAVPIASNQRGNVVPIYYFGFLIGVRHTISTLSSTAFFAEKGETYWVRVSNSEKTSGPITLRWHQGERPANDDFVAALDITGAEGELEGSNLGATLETGESLGQMAATTWHRWVAPSDGAWTFSVNRDHLRVAVFTGEQVNELRLVSGFPSIYATFRAQSEQVYRVAVAAEDAFATGEPYTVSWETTDWEPSRNDDFADRGMPPTGESGNFSWTLAEGTTVEPGEPPGTGARTIWWAWEAPSSGNYTWRLEDTGSSELTMAVFVGEAIESLSLVASTEPPVTGRELSFSAEGGTTYAFSLGWPTGDVGAYAFPQATGQGAWGRTPENDERTGAIALASTRGSAGANDQYGTTGGGELNDLLGHSSLWWKWEAPTDGWYSFNARDRYIAVYVEGSNAPLAQQWLVDGEVVFRAEAGVTYTVRAGSPATEDGGAYRLQWRPTDTPAWLRYVGTVTESVDKEGLAFPLSNPGSLAITDEDDIVFAVSDYGLEMFSRDAASGLLSASQTVDIDLVGSVLAWDPSRGRLLANQCDEWFSFVRDGSTFTQASVEIAEEPGDCGNKIITTPDGVSLYKTGSSGLDHYEVNSEGHLQFILTISDILDADVTADGSRLYTTNGDSLLEWTRDVVTGQLELGDSVSTRGDSLSTDKAGNWVFAVDENLADSYVYKLLPSLERGRWVDPSNQVFNLYSHDPYRFVTGRSSAAADFFGDSVVASVHSERDEITDAIANGLDRFSNPVPLFGVPNGLVASADGRHIYVSTDHHGILMFERIGQGVEPMDPHSRLDLIQIADGSVIFGATGGSDCIDVSDLMIDDVRYTVRESKWQWRPNGDWSWSDLPDTVVSGQLCTYKPDQPGQYRLVTEMEIDGETRWHSSNTVVQDDHQDSVDDATVVG